MKPTCVLALLLLLTPGCAVDETGYLRPEEIDTTSEEPLDEEAEEDVIIVGGEGAVEKRGGRLEARVPSSGASAAVMVEDSAGSFVLTVPARASDIIELSYELDGEDRLSLSLAGSAALPKPECMTCIGQLFSIPDEDGMTSVAAGLIDDDTPPFKLLNATRGIAVQVDDLASARIAASSGDRACLFRIDASGDTSQASCDLVP